jgi:hypothetical protein
LNKKDLEKAVKGVSGSRKKKRVSRELLFTAFYNSCHDRLSAHPWPLGGKVIEYVDII